ncbi:MAG TPA: 5-oxoprolinase subunit PxpA [Mycobacteriales bacterium]|nr:5-oxoprolinase subunit PxpA [Mycobacteriales bacterium]
MSRIDLNADLGESYGPWQMGDDATLLSVVSSASVACGFHAGDPATILRTVRAAIAAGVAVGAHVSYPDLVGFGRREMQLTNDEITADVLYQLGALDGMARSCGGRVAYVKPHGALYNKAAADPRVAEAIGSAIREFDASLPLLLLAGSAGAGIDRVTVVPEIFADRGYTPDGRLLPRSQPGAVIHDARAVSERVSGWLRTGTLPAVDGSAVPIGADSVCVHGDTPGAATMASTLRDQLTAAGVRIQAFA